MLDHRTKMLYFFGSGNFNFVKFNLSQILLLFKLVSIHSYVLIYIGVSRRLILYFIIVKKCILYIAYLYGY